MKALHQASQRDLAVASECILAAFTFRDSTNNDEEEVRARTGALLIAEALHDLSVIRQAHTKQE